MSASKSLKTYAVVEFLGYACVDPVPTSWMTHSEQGDYVYWPKNGATSKVRRNEMPDKENWKQYSVRTFCSTDDYDRAVYLAKKAEKTSNIDTEDNEGPTKRKKKRPSKYEDSDTDSGDNADAEEEGCLPSSFRKRGPQYQASKATSQLVAARKSPVLPRPPHRQVSVTVPGGATPNHEAEAESEISLLPHNDSIDDGLAWLPTDDNRASTPRQEFVSQRNESNPTSTPGQEFVIQRNERTEQRVTKAQDKGDRAFQLNVLVRLNELEKEVKEGNAMMRTILSGLHMSVEANEDPMDPMDSDGL